MVPGILTLRAPRWSASPNSGGCASTPLWSRPTFTTRPTAACWATRCGCCPAPTDSLEPIPSVDAEKRGDRKGEPDERQYDHCNSNDKRPEQIFPRSLRRRVDRVELPVLLIESFDNVIHRISSCTPAGRRTHPVSTGVLRSPRCEWLRRVENRHSFRVSEIALLSHIPCSPSDREAEHEATPVRNDSRRHRGCMAPPGERAAEDDAGDGFSQQQIAQRGGDRGRRVSPGPGRNRLC